MTEVTTGSLAYVATQVCSMFASLLQGFQIVLQVRFALSSSSVFSKSDMATDSERFYLSILEVLEGEDLEEQEDWRALKQWWNK
jgi:hypothetical protein